MKLILISLATLTLSGLAGPKSKFPAYKLECFLAEDAKEATLTINFDRRPKSKLNLGWIEWVNEDDNTYFVRITGVERGRDKLKVNGAGKIAYDHMWMSTEVDLRSLTIDVDAEFEDGSKKTRVACEKITKTYSN